MDKNTLLSSFGKWVSTIDFKTFEKHVETTNQDKYTKKLTTRAYLMLMIHAQLHEKESLRAISDDVLNEELQKILGFESISASQLSWKNNEVQTSILANVFLDLVRKFNAIIQRDKHPRCQLKSLILAPSLYA